MINKAVVGMVNGGWNMSAPSKYIAVQVFSMFLGIAAFVVLTYIDADILGSQWKLLCVINLLLLVALVIFGQDDGTGNKAWIRFAGIGIQPAEVIKILYIIVAARQMTYIKEHEDIDGFFSVVQMVGHFVVVFGLIIVVSSDLGSATVIMLIFLTMFFLLGVRLYWFALGGAAIAAMVPLLWEHFLKEYQKKRILAPYDPSIDPNNDGINWQTYQSKITLASGRTTGVDAEHRYTAFTGKHTDFIFSCIGEELGMIGCCVVIILLLLLILRCIQIGLRSKNTLSMLVCFGVAATLTFQTFINIGMCLGITPVIGLTLPFFSYGGSSIFSLFAACGLVSGIKFRPKPERFHRYG